MAHEKQATESAAPQAKSSAMSWVITAVVGLVSAGAGFAVPQLLGGGPAEALDETEHAETAHDDKAHDDKAHDDKAHGDKAPKKTHGDKATKKKHEGSGSAYLSFGEVVANLDDHRMMRYVRAKFSLSVAPEDSQAVQHLVDEKKLVLKNWLIGYLQNKQVEEVRGTEGFNRICREIQEQFNHALFPDGEEKINEILFEEFNVQ